MARKSSVVYAGAFFSALKSEYEKQDVTSNPFIRIAGTTERKVLDKAELIAVFQKIDKTVLDVFALAGIPIPLSDRDRKIVSALERMSEIQLNEIESFIHQICDAWWIDILNIGEKENCSCVKRFKQFALHKYPASAEKDFKDCPYLQSIYPFRMIAKIPTDDYPQLCRESGMPVSFLMDLPMNKVHFYSRNFDADRVFTEYSLIYSEALRKIIEGIILKYSDQKR